MVVDEGRTDERAVFVAALEMEPAAQRAAYLRETCRGDAALLTRVEALLKAHEEIGDFLEPASLDRALKREVAARAELQTVSDFLANDLLASVYPERAGSREVTVRYILDAASASLDGRFENNPLSEAAIRQTPAASPVSAAVNVKREYDLGSQQR